MEIEDLKLFLRVDGEEEDVLIEGLQEGAESYLVNAGIAKNYDDALYSLAIKLLVNNWYQNRETFINLKTAKVDYSLQRIITSLSYNQVEETEVIPE